MKVLIVGGRKGKMSGIITKLHDIMSKEDDCDVTTFNSIIPRLDIKENDLILWMPDISNDEEKIYPVKGRGAVLICSKVMREDTTRIDAVSRIFNMHGNAVVMINKHVGAHGQVFEFELVDALNNTWCKTTNLEALVVSILRLQTWTNSSKRRSLGYEALGSHSWKPEYNETDLAKFMSLNEGLALKVASGCGNRFFGNFSTRCTKLFPSHKLSITAFFFSARNSNKKSLTEEDLVLCDQYKYYGERKPSVDTPVQLEIYKNFPEINYMIHGHAYINKAKTTKNYYPCGDLREVRGVLNLMETGETKINLRKHGFLLVGKTIRDMERHYVSSKFSMIGDK